MSLCTRTVYNRLPQLFGQTQSTKSTVNSTRKEVSVDRNTATDFVRRRADRVTAAVRSALSAKSRGRTREANTATETQTLK